MAKRTIGQRVSLCGQPRWSVVVPADVLAFVDRWRSGPGGGCTRAEIVEAALIVMMEDFEGRPRSASRNTEKG